MERHARELRQARAGYRGVALAPGRLRKVAGIERRDCGHASCRVCHPASQARGAAQRQAIAEHVAL